MNFAMLVSLAMVPGMLDTTRGADERGGNLALESENNIASDEKIEATFIVGRLNRRATRSGLPVQFFEVS